MPTNQGVLANSTTLVIKRRVPTTLKNFYWRFHRHYSGVRKMYRIARPLREYFKHRVTISQAEEEIKKALESREERFFETVCAQVYKNPTSPYLALLKHAGCEPADLHTLLATDGLDKTLTRLASEGVYLTPDEFKGRKELKRGGFCARVSPRDFETPQLPGFGVQSSGTSGVPLLASLTLDHIAVRTYAIGTFLAAHDLLKHRLAVYDSILPTGTASIQTLLALARLGIATDRWFARPVPGDVPYGTIYDHLTTYLIVAMGKLVGPGFPRHQFVDIRNIDRIVHWISEAKKNGASCCIHAAASNAARVARVAWDMGISLENAVFHAGGEPVTEGKQQVVARVGARLIPRYSFTPGGQVGQGCPSGRFPDEVHVNEYMLAVIGHPIPLERGVDVIHPLLFTSLYPSSSHLLINVANGDYATMDRRNCGCRFEKNGLTLHLYNIRSYEKLTSEGMNFLFTDLFRLFEQTLPREFGGGPGDYQLVEEEDENSQTRLTMVVSPEVGNIDEERLLSCVQQTLGKGLYMRFWQDAKTFRVKRATPHASARGKILPLHKVHQS